MDGKMLFCTDQQLNMRHQLPATCIQAIHPPLGGESGGGGRGDGGDDDVDGNG